MILAHFMLTTRTSQFSENCVCFHRLPPADRVADLHYNISRAIHAAFMSEYCLSQQLNKVNNSSTTAVKVTKAVRFVETRAT